MRIVRPVLATTSVLLMSGVTLLSPVGPASAAEFTDPTTLGTTIGKPAATSIAALSTGGAAAAWTYHDEGAQEDRLERSFRSSSGGWTSQCDGTCVTTPEEQHTPVGHERKDPLVAAGGNGTYASAYKRVNDDGTSAVYLNGGNGFSAVSPTYDVGEEPTHLALAVGPTGQDVLAFEAQDADEPYVQVVGCCSTTFAIPGTTSISSVRAAVDADGRAIVAWQNTINTSHTLYVATRPANGSWSAPLALDGPALNAGNVALATAGGRTTVGWVVSNVGVRVRTLEGDTWSAPDGPSDWDGRLELALRPNGDAVALLDQGDTGKIFLRTVGQTVWPNVRNLASNHNVASHLAAGSDGTVTATYAIGSTLVADVRDAAGSWQTYGISDGGSTPQLPQLAAGPNGPFVIWAEFVSATSRYKVFVSSLSATSPPPITPPAAAVTKPTTVYQTGTSIAVGWTSSDPDGIASVTVRRTTATPRSGFSTPSNLFSNLAASGTKSFAAAPGRTYCLSARALDNTATYGAWSAARCTTTPLDDRSMAASRFTRVASSSAYRKTLSQATKKGATLTYTGVTARRIALLVARAPGQGKVTVYLGARKLGTFSLSGPAKAKHVINVRTFSTPVSGTLRIKVVTSGKRVRVDGVFAGR